MVKRWVFANDPAAASDESDSGEDDLGDEEEAEDADGRLSDGESDGSDEGDNADSAGEAPGPSSAAEAGPSSSSKQQTPKKGKISLSLGGLACHVSHLPFLRDRLHRAWPYPELLASCAAGCRYVGRKGTMQASWGQST